MGKERLEAFSDGVIAIIITVMVLELHVPAGTTLDALVPIIPIFLSYVLSFVFVGIYWNNHHHLLRAASRVNGVVLWANLLLLFFLSLIPFVTGWMGETQFQATPVALYGVILWFSAVSYTLLVRALISNHGGDSVIAVAIGDDRKGKLSLALYTIAIPLAFFIPLAACACYVIVAIIWFIPDQRIERKIEQRAEE